MLIKLRQTEIEEALKMYVVAQGIDLTNKNVKIDFTASRSNDGLTADLDITNGGQPAVSSDTLIPRSTGEAGTAGAQAQLDPVEPEPQEPVGDPAPAAQEPAPANSLFS